MIAGSRLDDPVRVGRYRVVGRLSENGPGPVYLARSARGQQVAARVIAPAFAGRARVRERLAGEIRAAAAVFSPYALRVLDADLDCPEPWVATEYVAGPALDLLVAEQGPLVPARLLAVAAALARGLGDIHQSGLAHRGLQPSTVILAADRPRIADLGSVVTGLEALAATGRLIGDPAYLSPEQAELEESGPASDIFSLGSVLAFAAVGSSPFGAGSAPELLARIVADAPGLADIPATVRPLVSWCLAKDGRDRPSAPEVLDRVYEIAARDLGLDAAGLDRLMAGITVDQALAGGPEDHGPRPGPAAGNGTGPLPAPAVAALWPGADDLTRPAQWPAAGRGTTMSLPLPAQDTAGAEQARRPGEGASRFRFLSGVLPTRAPVSAQVSLLTRITLIGVPDSAPPEAPAGPPSGTTVAITVSAPGLVPLGQLEQGLTVPFADDSEPVRFEFLAGRPGLHSVGVRVAAGGTFLGELTLQISVEAEAALEEGRARVAVLTGLATEEAR
jgi:hypothetical protein